MNDTPAPRHPKTLTWTEVQTYRDEGSKIQVVISKSDHYPFPRYSIRVGTEWPFHQNGQYTVRLFFNPRVHDQAKGQALMGDEFERLEVLLDQAKEWIQIDAAYVANQVLDARIARDEMQANRGKPVTPVTGKTERNRQKGKAKRAEP